MMSGFQTLILTLILTLVPFLNPETLEAQEAPLCSSVSGLIVTMNPTNPVPEGATEIIYTFKGNLPDNEYYLWARKDWDFGAGYASPPQTSSGGEVIVRITEPELLKRGRHQVSLKTKQGSGWIDFCRMDPYDVGFNFEYKDCQISINPSKPTLGQIITANVSNAPEGSYSVWFERKNLGINVKTDRNGNGNFTIGPYNTPKVNASLYLAWADSRNTAHPFCERPVTIESTTQPVTGSVCTIIPAQPNILTTVSIQAANNITPGKNYRADLVIQGINENLPARVPAQPSGIVTIPLTSPPNPVRTLTEGDYKATVYDENDAFVCEKSFHVDPKPGTTTGGKTVKVCAEGAADCSGSKGIPCGGDPKNPGISTAIGCVHTQPAAFIKDILRFLIGISGGIAFLFMLIGSFRMITSQGNPQMLTEGRETLTNAIIGILFIIFSVLLLRIIGVDILDIPGFR